MKNEQIIIINKVRLVNLKQSIVVFYEKCLENYLFEVFQLLVEHYFRPMLAKSNLI